MKRIVLGLCLLAGASLLHESIARAEDCPGKIPADAKKKRALAKQWFGKAETAESGGDQIAAVKAYQCSMKMVPHAFTAFNIGRLAEQTGDLELAVDAYGTYLKLSPQAQDRADIEGKVTALSARIETLRKDSSTIAQTPATEEPAPAEPTPAPAAAPAPAPQQTSVTDEPRPVARRRRPVRPPEDEASGNSNLPVILAVGAAGLVALGGGVALNISARSYMDECRSLAKNFRPMLASTQCDSAKWRAYASYGLFGLAGAALVTDLILVFSNNGKEGTRVAFAPLPGGGTVVTSFRF